MKKKPNFIRKAYNAFIDRIAVYYHKIKKIIFITICCLFIISGFVFNTLWEFPYFYILIPLIIIIGITAYFAEQHYKRVMDSVCSDVSTQPPFFSSRIQYYKQMSSKVNIFIPIAVVLLFGVGGCLLFGALEFNITFIWCITLFAIVVFISIQGYLQYLYLSGFLRNTAISNKLYINLPILVDSSLPKEIDWRLKLKKITIFYQVSFFGLGSLYIISFAMFCYLPGFLVNAQAIIFYVLWAVIFLAIVIAFPIVAILEMYWQRKITNNLKNSYNELWRNEPIIPMDNKMMSLIVNEMLRDRCLAFAFPGDKRGGKYYLRVLFSFASAIFNFAAAIITLVQFYNSNIIQL